MFLAGHLPQCFSAEDEARPPKIGAFQDLVRHARDEINPSRTQLCSALRPYTSSQRYLYDVRLGVARVDLNDNPCGELDEQYVERVHRQLEEAKARVQAQRVEQQTKERKATATIDKKEDAPRCECKPRSVPRREEDAERKPRAEKPAAKTPYAPRKEQYALVPDTSVLAVGRSLKAKAGSSAMDATVSEIIKGDIRIQLSSGMSSIVHAEHPVF